MGWPWSRKPEVRQGSYTDAVVALLVQAAGGAASGDPNATGALEASAGLWGRCFAAAVVEPEIPSLTPSLMAMIARALIRRGEAVLEIAVEDGRPVLHPIGDFDIRGSADPASWAYRCVRHGPSRTETTLLSADAVLHFRYAVEPSRPWRGIGPLGWAHRLGDLIGNSETRLAQEASGTVGRVLPMPQDGGDGGDADPLKLLKTDLAKGGGRLHFVETTSAGFGEGRVAAPTSDWMQKRIGPMPDEAFCKLREQAQMAVAAACGIPPALLYSISDGTLARESYRAFLHSAVRPVARTMADEIEAKIGTRPAFDFSALYASDLAGRAQAFQRLVAGGVAVTEALSISGLMVADDD